MEEICKEGWVCPKCGAVMSPYQVCCVNCTGKQTINVCSGVINPSTVRDNISISGGTKLL